MGPFTHSTRLWVLYLKLIYILFTLKQPTSIQTDNSIAEGVVNNKVQPKRMKPMDMRFHWLRCRINQKQFRFHWRPGTTNLADYWTKHHPGIHHKNFRREILTPVNKVQKLFKTGNSGNLLRGCVEHYGA